MGLWKDFKGFIMRGNVMDLAVGVIIGGAFSAIVTSLVGDIIMPVIGLFSATDVFEKLTFSVGTASVPYGKFIAAVVNFLIIAACVFFLVRGINALMPKPKPVIATPTTRRCPYCLSEVPLAATRCAHCTSDIAEPKEETHAEPVEA